MKFEPVTNKYAIWFGRVVWLGIIANFCFIIPTMMRPQRVIAFLNLDPVTPTIWVQCAVYLLGQLSLFYIPAAMNPYQYRANAYLAIFSRLAGTVFFWAAVLFFGYDWNYIMPFGIVDFAFAVPEAILLYLAFKTEKWA
ncbi:MAG: hypothetical protein AUG75_23245 [Cyanobacteria bacterium 13_1_20CM_4_61_6]|nr:MAG: hypothetical protein AUG75_23245 [Cyanobacteria bacterium 13_1_20CM_4_61_6]